MVVRTLLGANRTWSMTFIQYSLSLLYIFSCLLLTMHTEYGLILLHRAVLFIRDLHGVRPVGRRSFLLSMLPIVIERVRKSGTEVRTRSSNGYAGEQGAHCEREGERSNRQMNPCNCLLSDNLPNGVSISLPSQSSRGSSKRTRSEVGISRVAKALPVDSTASFGASGLAILRRTQAYGFFLCDGAISTDARRGRS